MDGWVSAIPFPLAPTSLLDHRTWGGDLVDGRYFFRGWLMSFVTPFSPSVGDPTYIIVKLFHLVDETNSTPFVIGSPHPHSITKRSFQYIIFEWTMILPKTFSHWGTRPVILRVVSHMDQELWPWISKGPWNPSKGHTMGCITPISPIDGPSSSV